MFTWANLTRLEPTLSKISVNMINLDWNPGCSIHILLVGWNLGWIESRLNHMCKRMIMEPLRLSTKKLNIMNDQTQVFPQKYYVILQCVETFLSRTNLACTQMVMLMLESIYIRNDVLVCPNDNEVCHAR